MSYHEGWWGNADDLLDIMEESMSGITEGTVETVDGCIVEPDGVCPHGFLSPLLEAGLI
jgi:hypothetical protein